MNTLGIAIFAVTYVLVSARRVGGLGLDRPAAALLGAVACVAFGVLPPDAALQAIDGDTLLLLFGVMGMGAFLQLDGFFDVVEEHLASAARSPARLLGLIVWGGGALSAFITNDAVCLLGAPVVVRVIQRRSLPPGPFLLALATAANTGSVATLVGNPQNMLCGQLGGLSYLGYLGATLPVALIALAINHAVVHFALRRALARIPSSELTRSDDTDLGGSENGSVGAVLRGAHAVTLGVVAATAVAYSLGAPLPWTATAGFVALMLLHRRDTSALWRHVDWSLLLFFAGLFVVTEAFRQSGATDWFFSLYPLDALTGFVGHMKLAGIFVVGSNLVSNVPFILVVQDQVAALADPERAWTLLAVTSTFAGNLTLLGSAANVIVAEAARPIGGLGFWQHILIGAPIAVLTTLAGAFWLWVVG